MKTCKTCGVRKPLEEYNRTRKSKGLRPSRGADGRESHCGYCKAEKRSPGIHARREAAEKEATELFASGLKRCSKCDVIKPLGGFSVRRVSQDGLCPKCKDCYKIYATVWREENPDSFKTYYAEKKTTLQQKYKEWREENADSRAEYMAQWGRENAALVAEKNMRRHAGKIQATPKWANRERMVEFYKEAERLTAETGIQHHVDHIYPLQGKIVCGLHCEANLNVITQFENIQKLNRMPTEEYLQRCEK